MDRGIEKKIQEGKKKKKKSLSHARVSFLKSSMTPLGNELEAEVDNGEDVSPKQTETCFLPKAGRSSWVLARAVCLLPRSLPVVLLVFTSPEGHESRSQMAGPSESCLHPLGVDDRWVRREDCPSPFQRFLWTQVRQAEIQRNRVNHLK